MVDTITGVEEYKARLLENKEYPFTKEQKEKRKAYMRKYRKLHPYISRKKNDISIKK